MLLLLAGGSETLSPGYRLLASRFAGDQHASARAAPRPTAVEWTPCLLATACLPACLFRARRCCFCFADASSQQHTFKLRAHDERDLCSSSSSSDENLSSLARLQSFQARTGWLSDTGRRLVQTPSRTCQPRQALPAADSTDYRRHRDQQPSNGLLRARPSAVVLLLLAGGSETLSPGYRLLASRFAGDQHASARKMDLLPYAH